MKVDELVALLERMPPRAEVHLAAETSNKRIVFPLGEVESTTAYDTTESTGRPYVVLVAETSPNESEGRDG